MKKDDLAKCAEEVICWRLLDRTVQIIKERNQDISPEILEAMIDNAVREVRMDCKVILG